MLRVSTIFLVCALALHPIYGDGDGKNEDCLPHQVWDSCGTACPLNCQNFRTPPEACIKSCERGCFCKKPYIFQNGASGPCVLSSQCPPSQEKICPPNQVWESCGSDCPLNCQNFRNPPKICPTVCRTGCTCKGPYIFLRGKSGLCVLPRQCPPSK